MKNIDLNGEVSFSVEAKLEGGDGFCEFRPIVALRGPFPSWLGEAFMRSFADRFYALFDQVSVEVSPPRDIEEVSE